MKKVSFCFSSALFFCLCLHILQPTRVQNRFEKEAEEDNPADPGWEEQYLRMKGDANGEIPRGVMHRIALREAANKTMTPYLQNVTETGPEFVGGRTRSILIDAANHNRFFAAGISGGIWVSPDKGANWAPVDDQQLTLSVTSISQAPGQPAVIYFSTGEPRGNSAGIPGDGIFKSTDGGATFNQLPATVLPDFDNTWKVQVRASNDNHVFAGTRWGGLYRSTNAGTTWNTVFDPVAETDVADIETFSDGKILIGVNGMGVYQSTTGDTASFTRVNGGLPANGFRRVEIAYCSNFPNVIYAAFEDSTASTYSSGLKDIYKSINGGLTWLPVTNPQTSIFLAMDFPWYGFLLSVKPDDPNFVMTGSVSMAYSFDGGSNWIEASYSHADYHTATWDRDLSAFVYVGNDGGIHRYDIATMAITSQSLNNFYNVTQYYAGAYYPSGNTTLGGTQDNGTHKCSNGASDFFHVYGGDGSFCQVNQQNPLVSYVSYQRGMIHRAFDSDQDFPGYSMILGALDGNGDQSIDEGAWFINPFEINLVDGDQVYFTTYERIWRSNNGGTNWVPLTDTIRDANGKSPYCISISNSASPEIYIGGEQGLFYRVSNADIATPGNEVDLSASVPFNVTDDFIGCIESHPAQPYVVFVAFTNYSAEPRIWKVADVNNLNPTWTDISGDLPEELPVNWIECDPINPENVLIIATDAGVYTTTNGGTNWVKETTLPNVSVHMIKLRSSDNKLFIFTHGRGEWMADVPNSVSRDEAIANFDVTVYPNPVWESIGLFSKNQSITADRWTLTDMNGKPIKSGMNAHEIYTGTLPAGTYLLKIWKGDKSASKKIVKQ